MLQANRSLSWFCLAGLATGALADVPAQLTRERLDGIIDIAAAGLAAMGVHEPRLALAGLNRTEFRVYRSGAHSVAADPEPPHLGMPRSLRVSVSPIQPCIAVSESVWMIARANPVCAQRTFQRP